MGRTEMSQEELRRVEVLARVRSNQLRVVDASRLLGMSYRQAKRLWKRYREEGPASLKHRSAGCTSNHAYAPKFRQRVLDLVRKKYGGPVGERFGPTLAAEHLDAEDGLVVNAETLRLWMLEAGQWSRQRKRRKHRRRRERKEHFGEPVQMDGSKNRYAPLVGAPYFVVDMFEAKAPLQLSTRDESGKSSVQILTAIEGCGVVEVPGMDPVTLAKGDAVIIPACVENFGVRPQWTLEFLRSYVPGKSLPEPETRM